MSKVLEFLIKLRSDTSAIQVGVARVSSALDGLTSVAQRTSSSMTSSLGRVQGEAVRTGSALRQSLVGQLLNSPARQVYRQHMDDLQQIRERARQVGSSLRQAFSLNSLGSSLMAIPGMSFLMNPYTLIAGGVGAIAKIGSQAELTATSFEVLVGSEEKSSKMLKEIAKFGQESPFDKMGLTENARQMLAFGIEADKVMGYLRQLGDISAGDKQKLDSLSLVMGQVMSKGRLDGQDKNQFVDAGFNPLKELQKMHPEKTYAEIEKAMSKGAITAQHVAEAIQHATQEGGQFHDMTEKTSKTLVGKLGSLMDDIVTMAEGLYQKIEPILKSVVDNIAGFIPYVSQILKTLFDWIVVGVEWIKSAVNWIIEWKDELMLVGSIIGILTLLIQAKTIALTIFYGLVQGVIAVMEAWSAVQGFLNLVMAANPVLQFVAGIAILISFVVYCWNKFAGFRAFLITMWDTMKQFGNIIKEYVVNRIKEMIAGLGKIAGALVKLFKGDFSGAFSDFKAGVGNLMGKESATKAFKASQEVVHNIKGNWQKNLKKEEAKDAKKSKEDSSIKTPSQKGSVRTEWTAIGEGSDKKNGKGHHGKGTKTGEALATGGSRPTNITISIGKLIETMKVMMMEKADTAELEKLVLQALNRSLAIAQSTEQ